MPSENFTQRKILPVCWLLFLILPVVWQPFAWAQEAQTPQMYAAVTEIGRIGKGARGAVGVAARHLETGHKIALHADECFPMASTVKVAIALKLLDMVDRGEIRLTARIPLERSELMPEGPLGNIRWQKGLSVSVADLLKHMMAKSDNTSTDVLYRVVGGPAAVHRHLQALGVDDIHPARYIRELLRDVLSIPAPASQKMSLAVQYRRMLSRQAKKRRARAYRANPVYDADPRDQATPDAMLELLSKIWLADGISGSARSTLLDVMQRNSTGQRRIGGRLPLGISVAGKTGTLAGTTNDAGFMTLPDARGHIAIVVFVKGSKASVARRERVIADIARLVYDYFLISTP